MRRRNDRADDKRGGTLTGSRRAVMYRRSATSKQHDTPDLERQRRTCRGLAKRLHAAIVDEYEDFGPSGAARPGLQALRRRLSEHPRIDYVIVRSRDRIARDLSTMDEFKMACEAAGVQLVTADDSGPSTPASRFMAIVQDGGLVLDRGGRP